MRSRAKATVGLLASTKRKAVGKLIGRMRTSDPEGEVPISPAKPWDFSGNAVGEGSCSVLEIAEDWAETMPALKNAMALRPPIKAVRCRNLVIRKRNIGASLRPALSSRLFALHFFNRAASNRLVWLIMPRPP